MSAFDSSIDRSNNPSGKSTQTYYFKNHYDAKHAIGSKHKKRLDFESRDGISDIISACNKCYNNSESPLDYGRFIISGKPPAVDSVMVEINNWLSKCQEIYTTNY